MGRMTTLGVLRLRVPKGWDTSLRMTLLWGDVNKRHECSELGFALRQSHHQAKAELLHRLSVGMKHRAQASDSVLATQ
jgi:hypothetical protein